MTSETERDASYRLGQYIWLDAEIADGVRFRPNGGLDWAAETRAVQDCVGLTISPKSHGPDE